MSAIFVWWFFFSRMMYKNHGWAPKSALFGWAEIIFVADISWAYLENWPDSQIYSEVITDWPDIHQKVPEMHCGTSSGVMKALCGMPVINLGGFIGARMQHSYAQWNLQIRLEKNGKFLWAGYSTSFIHHSFGPHRLPTDYGKIFSHVWNWISSK